MNPPLKWHGGKHYLAKRIVALMPPHLHYVEPYAGGLAVLLAKDPEGVSEVVNDVDGGLINFWRTLRHEERFAALRRMVETTPFSEEEWDRAEDVERYMAVKSRRSDGFMPRDMVKWAWAFFVRCRQSLAGRMKAFAPLSRNRVRRGMNEQASAWLAAVDGLPEVHKRLRRVAVLNRDALDVIRVQDGEHTLFYLDPPYLHETRAAKDAYAHEMSDEGHHNLLCLVRQLNGAVMLSGYRNPMYDDLLGRWSRVDFDLPNNAAGGGEKRRMVECVWSNRRLAA